MAPIGGYQHPEEWIEINPGRPVTEVAVTNLGDRPIQVGSHFHFAEANRALAFNREAAYGCRLDIPAGTAQRFEPGESRKVKLVPIGGRRVVGGFNGLVEGELDREDAPSFGRRAREAGFRGETAT